MTEYAPEVELFECPEWCISYHSAKKEDDPFLHYGEWEKVDGLVSGQEWLWVRSYLDPETDDDTSVQVYVGGCDPIPNEAMLVISLDQVAQLAGILSKPR